VLSSTGQELSPEFLANRWKPGQSGNPSGRPRKLTDPLEAFLEEAVPGDPEQRSYKKLLVQTLVKRAITRSDVLMKEIFDRVEGRVRLNDEETAAQLGVKVVVIDVARPDYSDLINVTPRSKLIDQKPPRPPQAGAPVVPRKPPVDPAEDPRPKD
jgi:hypothetical protein